MISEQNLPSLPHVTIIIPVYNAGNYITESLDSAFAQTYKNLDVVCIDDCSTDNSVAIIQEYRKTLPDTRQLILLQLEKNSGPSVARNKGIQIAQGTYILPLDADDKIDPAYTEKAINCFIADPSVDVVYCRATTIGDDVSPYDFPPYDPGIMVVRNLVFATAFFKKSDWARYNGYNENMRTGLEDWDFWLHFTEDNKKFFQMAETLFFYRKHGESRTDSAQKNYSALKKQIRGNHPKIYGFHAHLSNPYLRKDSLKKAKRFIKNIRKWFVHIRLKKNEKTIRLIGVYLLHKKSDQS
jgi:glycosyltransferase involved in cell wall biosynthesis